jgi:pyruvate decarboxylase
MQAEYNDIQTWKNKELVDIFGGEKTSKKFAVKTKDELESLLSDANFNAAKELQFVELYMEKEDAPRALVMTAQASAEVNKKKE